MRNRLKNKMFPFIPIHIDNEIKYKVFAIINEMNKYVMYMVKWHNHQLYEDLQA